MNAPNHTDDEAATRAMDTPEIHPVHAHASHTRHWSDYLMSGAALLVSAVSLWVAVHHGHTMERLVQANSFPSVQVDTDIRDGSRPESMTLAVSVTNAGVGPARLEWIELWSDGKPVGDLDQLMAALKTRAGVDSLAARVEGSSIGGALIGAGRGITLLGIEFEDRARFTPAALDVVATLDSRTCYCSVFDECFVADTRERSKRPRRVEQCPVPALPFSDDLEAALRKRLPRDGEASAEPTAR